VGRWDLVCFDLSSRQQSDFGFTAEYNEDGENSFGNESCEGVFQFRRDDRAIEETVD